MNVDEKTPSTNGPVKLSVRPEIIEILPRDATEVNTIAGVIVQRAYMGPVIEYSVETKAGILFTRASAHSRQFQQKEKVSVRIRPDDIIIIPENDNDD